MKQSPGNPIVNAMQHVVSPGGQRERAAPSPEEAELERYARSLPADPEERERVVTDRAFILFGEGFRDVAKSLLRNHHPGGPKTAAIVFEAMVHDSDPERLEQAKRARAEVQAEIEAEVQRRVDKELAERAAAAQAELGNQESPPAPSIGPLTNVELVDVPPKS